MHFEPHLALSEIILPAGARWTHEEPGWRLARLHEGHGYWLSQGAAREVQAGEVLILPRRPDGEFLASRLTPVKFHFFRWHPELLSGILTLAELHYFATSGLQQPTPLRVLPADSDLSRQFEILRVSHPGEPPLWWRSKLLQFIAEAFRPEFSRPPAMPPKAASAAGRFHQMIAEMTDGEIVNFTPPDLAKRCGCGPRHFSRLFHEHFGASVRSKQTQLRLQKAALLLSRGEAKIIDVAMDSGYRSLGLFNKLFKKHTGTTPSQWRRRAQGPDRSRKTQTAGRWLALALVLACVWTARAAPQAVSPSTNAPAGPAFKVSGYHVVGNTVLEQKIVDKALAPYTGEAVTFDTIRRALSDLQMAYRDRGFVTVQVGLPQQRLTNGIVRVQVTEGKLADISVTIENHHYSSNNVMRALPGLHTNLLLNSLVFQQILDHANENRDRQIYPEIGPGPEPGTTSLHLKVIDRFPLHGRVDYNNESTPETPDMRVNTSLQYNNLWQLDHQLGIQYLFSPTDTKDTRDHIYDVFDEPRIDSYSAFYSLPLPGGEGDAGPASLTSASFGYDEVAHRFRAPQMTRNPALILFASRGVSDTGNNVISDTLTPPTIAPAGSLQVRNDIASETLTFNEDVGFRYIKPLPQFQDILSGLSFGLDYKAFRQYITDIRTVQATLWVPEFGTNGPPFSAFPSPPDSQRQNDPGSGSVNYLPFTLSWDGMRRDKWGSTRFSLNQSFNFVALSASGSSDFAHIAQTSISHASGNYYIVTPSITREQNLYHEWGLTLNGNAQWANQSLIGNEQFGIGGPAGPRGYRDGEEYGDSGWRVSVEPHTPLLNVTMINQTIPLRMRGSIFTDYGQRHDFTTKFTNPDGTPIPVPDRVATLSLWGTGLGIAGTIGQTYDFHLTLAFPLISTARINAWTPHFYFAVSAQF